MQVARGRGEIGVTEQALDHWQRHSGFQQMRRERVSERMDAPVVRQPRQFYRPIKNQHNRISSQMTIRPVPGRKHPAALRPIDAPVRSQLFEQPGGKARVPVLQSFALLDPDLSAFAQNMFRPQIAYFADAQARSVRRHQDGAMFEIEAVTESSLAICSGL